VGGGADGCGAGSRCRGGRVRSLSAGDCRAALSQRPDRNAHPAQHSLSTLADGDGRQPSATSSALSPAVPRPRSPASRGTRAARARHSRRGILSARQGGGKRRGGSAIHPVRMALSGLSGAPRIAQGRKPSQGVTAIDRVMHQEALDEARISFLRERNGAVFTFRMIEASSYLDKLKYQLRRLSPQRRIGARC
jgi:hypothetical protein